MILVVAVDAEGKVRGLATASDTSHVMLHVRVQCLFIPIKSTWKSPQSNRYDPSMLRRG